MDETERKLRLEEQKAYLDEIERVRNDPNIPTHLKEMMLSTITCMKCKEHKSAPGHAYCLNCQFNDGCRHRNIKENRCLNCGETLVGIIE